MNTRKKIAIVTTGHSGKDDRVYYKFAKSFQNNFIETHIITTLENVQFREPNISVSGEPKPGYFSKSNFILRQLFTFSPSIVICSEVFAVLPALYYKVCSTGDCSIIYDITEWYPENVAFKKRSLQGGFTYLFLYAMMIIFSFFIDGYIAGEKRKLNRFLILSPGKPNEIVSYFPPLSQYPAPVYKNKERSINLGFTGLLTPERGLFRFLDALRELALKHQDFHITGTIIGKFIRPEDEGAYNKHTLSCPANLFLNFHGWQRYEDFSNILKDVDICIDLRDDKFIYRNSLPIKIFEYMACGKPVIYSTNEAIEAEFNISKVGFFVEPGNIHGIIETIETYMDYPALIEIHGAYGRKLVEQRFNWEMEEKKLLKFIQRF